MQGAGHVRSGQECQDAHGWHALPNGLVLAVADGAGSAPQGGLGARRAVDAALDFLQHPPSLRDRPETETGLRGALSAARNALAVEAMRRGIEERELATTLILAVVTPEGLSAAQVGDGAVVVGMEPGTLSAVTLPGVEEFLNQTVFLTSDGALEGAQVAHHAGPVAQVALFSDGLQMLALRMPEGTPHAPFFTPLFRFASEATNTDTARGQLEQFLRSPRIAARTDDDLTLLLATLPS